MYFFFNDTATTEIYTLSLHDALPIFIKDLTPEALEEGKKYIAEHTIDIKLKDNIAEKLYVEVCCEAAGDRSTAIIAGAHTNFIYEERNATVLLDKRQCLSGEQAEDDFKLDMRSE